VTPAAGQKARLRAWGLGTLAGLLGILAAVVLYNSVLMPRFVRTGAGVRVPDVRRLEVDQAESRLAASGLSARIASRRHSSDVEAGCVLAQDPAGGIPAKRGRQISLVVSLGKGGVRVPDLRGQGSRAAEMRLRDGGLELGRTVRAPSPERAGTIIATSPGASAEVEPGARVDWLVSDGLRPQPLVMPRVSGLPAAQVLEWFESLDLSVTVRRTFEHSGRPGIVARQQPEAGGRLDRSMEVVLYVSR
jgi:serine/threonine-protein kinase